MNKEYIVLYHARCLDGKAAAFAAWLKLKDTADYIAVQYGEEPDYELCKNKSVFIVDFSYKSEILVKLIQVAKSVYVLDHHATALPELEKTLDLLGCDNDHYNCFNYTYDKTRSGCVITWEYFHTDPVPELLLHIQDNDLFKFESPDSKEICVALISSDYLNRPFGTFYLLTDHWDYGDTKKILIKNGETVISALKLQQLDIMLESYECFIRHGERSIKGLAVNTSSIFRTSIGNLLAIRSTTYGVVWQRLATGKYKVSLRSNGTLDVSAIALEYGGGGHFGAASVILTEKEFKKMLRTKP